MKATYESPVILVQAFVPNEYVAACGDSGTVYNFVCNAGEGTTYRYWDWESFSYKTTKYVWKVVTDDGRTLTDEWSGLYGPCGTTHQAEADDDFINGHMDNYYTTDVNENIPVIIWTEGGTNVHCTANLNMSTWETAKS